MHGVSFIATLLAITVLVTSSYGQDFSIPSGWRVSSDKLALLLFTNHYHVQEPTSSRSRFERVGIAQTAIQSLIPAINTSNGATDPGVYY